MAQVPLEKGTSLPDVGVAHTPSRRVCDILLLKQVVHCLSYHSDGVANVS